MRITEHTDVKFVFAVVSVLYASLAVRYREVRLSVLGVLVKNGDAPRSQRAALFQTANRGQSSPSGTAAAGAGIVASVGLAGLVEQYGLGGILYALILETIAIIQGFASGLFAPFSAFFGGVARLTAAVFPVRIVNAGADQAAFSLTQGQWSFLGPFAFAAAVAATLAGVYVFVEIVSRLDLGLFSRVLGGRGR